MCNYWRRNTIMIVCFQFFFLFLWTEQFAPWIPYKARTLITSIKPKSFYPKIDVTPKEGQISVFFFTLSSQCTCMHMLYLYILIFYYLIELNPKCHSSLQNEEWRYHNVRNWRIYMRYISPFRYGEFTSLFNCIHMISFTKTQHIILPRMAENDREPQQHELLYISCERENSWSLCSNTNITKYFHFKRDVFTRNWLEYNSVLLDAYQFFGIIYTLWYITYLIK